MPEEFGLRYGFVASTNRFGSFDFKNEKRGTVRRREFNKFLGEGVKFAFENIICNIFDVVIYFRVEL